MVYETEKQIINNEFDKKLQPLFTKMRFHENKVSEIQLEIEEINYERSIEHEKNRKKYSEDGEK